MRMDAAHFHNRPTPPLKVPQEASNTRTIISSINRRAIDHWFLKIKKRRLIEYIFLIFELQIWKNVKRH